MTVLWGGYQGKQGCCGGATDDKLSSALLGAVGLWGKATLGRIVLREIRRLCLSRQECMMLASYYQPGALLEPSFGVLVKGRPNQAH